MAKTITREKNINLVKDILDTANKEGWVLTLDRDEGALFYAPKIISDKTEHFQITDEYAVYLDKRSNPKGVMIECYGVNFIKHHPEFEAITERVFSEDNENEIETVNPKTNKSEDVIIFKSLLEKTLLSDVIRDDLIVSR